ncbi:GNAT family N-acetyltransferase [Fluviicola chungangensis]|uniref:GNAT family N-acetyltransferase n=1 Tax=Fluviicola chungangensis TaxID=2597671 RepID=A0A556N726_9FLAO|nr:GNAT family N-acetyltransferase [Fluviicola chungangensis]TSJ47986.1 GNAT family N-acetyltransferase [Fluviicola chungangensis]
MDTTKIRINPIKETEEVPYNLLLLSDDTKEAIEKNLDGGELYLGKYKEQFVAAFILKVVQNDTIEIKNIAVIENLQGKGIGTILLNYIKEKVKQRGFQKLLVGTCDQCEKEIEFYKKSDFMLTGIRKNFFLENYNEPIYENGKQIIDMVILEIDL